VEALEELKMQERSGNVIENKGPVDGNEEGTGNAAENKELTCLEQIADVRRPPLRQPAEDDQTFFNTNR
jgi:hypothetical protein